MGLDQPHTRKSREAASNQPHLSLQGIQSGECLLPFSLQHSSTCSTAARKLTFWKGRLEITKRVCS